MVVDGLMALLFAALLIPVAALASGRCDCTVVSGSTTCAGGGGGGLSRTRSGCTTHTTVEECAGSDNAYKGESWFEANTCVWTTTVPSASPTRSPTEAASVPVVRTITAARDACARDPGGIVKVKSELEVTAVGSPFEFAGHGCTLTGRGKNRIISLQDAADLVAWNLTLKRGFADMDCSEWCDGDRCGCRGGGIKMATNSAATFSSCVFRSNQNGGHGGAVGMSACAATFSACVFRSNTASPVARQSSGGAVHMEASGAAGTFLACAFDSNVVTGWSYLGGSAVNMGAGSGTANFSSCTFRSNKAPDGDGAIYGKGAVVLYDTSTAAFSACTFQSNLAGGYPPLDGGAVKMEGSLSSATFSSSTFEANVADEGGALLLQAMAVVSACFFRSNRPKNRGGAVFVETKASVLTTSTPTLSECTFQGNSGEKWNSGAGVAVEGDKFTVAFLACVFRSNLGSEGGAVQVKSKQASTATFSGCAFWRNVARTQWHAVVAYGGAVTLGSRQGRENDWGAGTTALISGCSFESNSALPTDSVRGERGGAIFMTTASTATVSACVFRHNTAVSNGGAVSMELDSAAVFSDCAFESNSADQVGGAIRINRVATTVATVVNRSTFAFNEAGHKGAGICAGQPDGATDAEFGKKHENVPYREGHDEDYIRTRIPYLCEYPDAAIAAGGSCDKTIQVAFPGGRLVVSDCVFLGNSIVGIAGAGTTTGSAIAAFHTNLTLRNVHVTLNRSLVSGEAWASAIRSDDAATCADPFNSALVGRLGGAWRAVQAFVESNALHLPQPSAATVCNVSLVDNVKSPFACVATVGEACRIFPATECMNETFSHDTLEPLVCAESGAFPGPRPGCAACTEPGGCACRRGECFEKHVNATANRLACRPCLPLPGFDCPGWTTGERPCDDKSGEYCPDASVALASPCPEGHFCPDSATLVPCAAGRFGTVAGARSFESSCEFECGAGFSSAPGSPGCQACNETASFCAAGSAQPQNAAAGFFTTTDNVTGLRIDQAPCPADHFCTAGVKRRCSRCGSGTFVKAACTVVADAACLACPSGTIQPTADEPGCTQCEAGTFQNGTEHATCDVCPAAFFRGATNALVCSPCAACAGGTYRKAGSCTRESDAVCEYCPGGTEYLNATSASCVPCRTCPAGTYVASPCSATSDRVCFPCASGSVQPNTTHDQISCESCAAGRYQNSSSCLECPTGFYQTNEKKAECTPCATCQPGKRVASACTSTMNRECVACEIGTFSAAENNATCVACPAEHFQASSGKQFCAPCAACAAGMYRQPGTCTNMSDAVCDRCPAKEFLRAGSFCQPCGTCPQGRYQAAACTAAEDTVCELCTACGSGTYLDADTCTATSSGKCVGCAAGTYLYLHTSSTSQNGTGTGTACVQCPRGYSQPESGAQACVGCSKEKGEVQAADGKVACDTCFASRRVPDAASVRCECEQGSYDGAAASGNGTNDQDCTVCPVGGLCCERRFGPGVIRLLAGYWRPPTFKGRLFACPVRDACRGFHTAKCPSGIGVGVGVGNVTTGCARGHTGPGCGTCVDDYKPDMSGMCIDCGSASDASRQTTQLALFVVVTLAVVAARATFEIRYGAAELKKTQQLQKADKAVEEVSELSAQLVVLLPFLQRMGAIDVALPKVGLPHIPQVLVDILKTLYANLAQFFIAVSPCDLHLSYFLNLGISLAVVPWLSIVLLLVYAIVRSVMRRRRGWHRAETRARLLGNVMYGSKLLHPFISQICLQVLLCTELADDTFYLNEDASVECSAGDPTYVRLVAVSIAGCIAWVIGIPALLFTSVARDRRRLARDVEKDALEDGKVTRQLLHVTSAKEKAALRMLQIKKKHIRSLHSKLHRSVTPFTAGTKPKYYYLFILDMFISFVFIAFLGVLARDFVELQITLSIVMAVVQLVVPAALRPYENSNSTRLAVVGAVVFGCMQLAALTKYFAMTSAQGEATTDNKAAAAAVRSKLDGIDAVLTVVFVGGVFCLLLAALPGLLASLGQLAQTSMSMVSKTRRTPKVVPLAGPAHVAGPLTRSLAKKDEPAANAEVDVDADANAAGALDAMPNTITRPPGPVLARLPTETLDKYIRAYRALYEIHTHVMVTGIQAAVRGKSARVHLVSVRRATVKAIWGDEANRSSASRREADLARQLAAERKHEAELEKQLAAERRHEAVLEKQLAAERRHEAVLEKQLAAERRHEAVLEKQLTRMKLRIAGKHLAKAADEAEAKRIMADHFEEHAEHQASLKREQRRRSTVSKARHKRRRFKHVLAALRVECGTKTDAELRALLDANGDGVVSLAELWRVLESLTLASGHKMTEGDAEALLKEVKTMSTPQEGEEQVVVAVDDLVRGIRVKWSTAGGRF